MTFDDRRRQQMDIGPSGAAAMQLSAAYKGHDVGVWHFTGLMNFLVAGEKFRAATDIPDQKFAIDQFVADDLVAEEQRLKQIRVGRPVRKIADPDRGVD